MIWLYVIAAVLLFNALVIAALVRLGHVREQRARQHGGR